MTTTPITPERLREIAKLCEAATPGPWRQDCQIRVVAGPDSNPTDIIDYDHALHGEPPGASELADLAFIAASRTAIPDLLAEVARLKDGCDEAVRQRNAAIAVSEERRAEVLRLTETARAASENWMAACKQRDEARADVDLMRVECNDAADTDTELYAARTRIAALETALREACGYIDPSYCDDGTTTPTKDRLLAVAGAVESRTP